MPGSSRVRHFGRFEIRLLTFCIAHDACQREERGEEAQRDTHEKVTLFLARSDLCTQLAAQEQAQPSADRAQEEGTKNMQPSAEHDFEGGFGGQEELEDRYATTCGEH